jgi:alpha-glucosidase
MARVMRRAGMVLMLCVSWCALAAAQGWQHIGAVQKVEELKSQDGTAVVGMELRAGDAAVRITQFRAGVFRVRVAPNGKFGKDASWAVDLTPRAYKDNLPQVKIQNQSAEVKMAAGDLGVVVNKSPLLIRFVDAAGKILLADEKSLPMAWDGAQVHVWKAMPEDENYYGLGDKAGPMNRRNRAFTMWNTDEYGWQESSDPLYKTIPFFIGLRKGAAYGVFFDNAYRSSFDFGKESRDYFSFGAEGGELNYYFLTGPDPKKVVQEFVDLTGHTPLPPLWSLGYQQSRYTYYPEEKAREIVKRLRADKIPADAIYFDIDYQQGNAPFTVNRTDFPHFEGMIADFRKQGLRTVLITDLHIKKDPNHGYAPYDSGLKNDAFVKNPDGSVYVGTVWPGESVFPDFTLTRVRDWWGGLYKDFVGMGAAGFWNDMNEPSVFLRADKTMPPDIVHRLDDGTKLDHRAVHNIFGMENARATYEGLRKLKPDERPFVLTRAAYAGAQQYAATWTGDNSSTWNHLKMSTPMLLSMGICGYPLVGDDIGGFATTPSSELLTRWFELGAFNPIYRDHAGKGTGDHEPWAHGPEQEAIRRQYIEMRYKLLPYIYSSIEETSRTGIPLMRPLFLEYPQTQEITGDDRDFLFGPDLFVTPVFSEEDQALEIHLPPGEWYEYKSSWKHKSGDKIESKPALDLLPVWVRAGAIVPEEPLVQSTEETPDGPLELHVYPGEDCHGSLYQDDGHTFAYQRGVFLRMDYVCQMAGQNVTVASRPVHTAFHPWWSSTQVTIYGNTSAPKEVEVNREPIRDWKFDSKWGTVTLTVPDSLKEWTVHLSF